MKYYKKKRYNKKRYYKRRRFQRRRIYKRKRNFSRHVKNVVTKMAERKSYKMGSNSTSSVTWGTTLPLRQAVVFYPFA